MLSIVGIVVVVIMVFGGYVFAGGKIAPIAEALPTELMVIGGGAIGAFISSNGFGVIKKALGGFAKVIKGPKWKEDDYRDLLCLLFILTKLVKTKGVIALEQHIEHPEEFEDFSAIPENCRRPPCGGLHLRLSADDDDELR